MNQIVLAYCQENAEQAQKIANDLGRLGLPFEMLHDGMFDMTGAFAQNLQNTQDGVLLLITDNFLKSRSCLSGLLPAFQRMRRERIALLPVVADGYYREENHQEYTRVETHLDRMVYALQYMNHWQSVWLEISNRYEHAGEGEREVLRQEMEVVHDVANEVGEMIAALREMGYLTWEELLRDNYAAFFSHFNLESWHQQYEEIVRLEKTIPAPAIPVPEVKQPQPAEMPAEPQPPTTVLASPSVTEGGLIPRASLTGLPQAEEEFFLEDEEFTAPEVESPTLQDEDEIQQTIQDARFWMENGQYDRGLALLEAALEQYPEHSSLLEEHRQAQKHLQQVNPSAARDHVELASITSPVVIVDNPELNTYLSMGEDAVAKGDYLFAKFCWDRVAELNPQYPDIFKRLGLLTSQHLPEYKETAVHYLRMALQQNPADAEAHYRLAQVLNEQFGDLRSALFHLEQATDVNPGYAPAWLELAKMVQREGHREAAAEYYLKAAQLQPLLRTEELDRQFLPVTALPSGHEQPHPVSGHQNELETPLAGQEDLVEIPGLMGGTSGITETASTLEWDVLMPLPEEEQQAEIKPGILQPSQPIGQDIQGPIQWLEPDTASSVSQFEPESSPAPQASESATEQLQEIWQVPAQPDPGAPTVTVTAPPVQTISQKGVLTILITGASSGIGRATAEIFAQNGHRVIIAARREERLEILKEILENNYGAEVLPLEMDVRDHHMVESVLNSRPENWQNIDILINNAGLAKGLAPIHEGELSHWETMIDTNIKGLLYVTRVVSPGMVKRGSGHIINIGSTAGKEVYPKGNVYCATKFAVDALTKSMRLDLHAYGIRVSQVSPGHVEETEFAVTRFDGDSERARIYEDFQPLKAADVARTIYFIATQPAHVNIQDVLMMATQQASTTIIDRSGR